MLTLWYAHKNIRSENSHVLRTGVAYRAMGFTGGGFRSTTSIPEERSSALKASAAPSTAFLEALKATNPVPALVP